MENGSGPGAYGQTENSKLHTHVANCSSRRSTRNEAFFLVFFCVFAGVGVAAVALAAVVAACLQCAPNVNKIFARLP